MAAARAVEAAAAALLSRHRASPGSATGGRSSEGLSRVPSISLEMPLGWHPSSRARVASRLDATTTRRIVPKAMDQGRVSAARLLARWHQRSRCLEREQGTDQGHNCSVDRVYPGALSLYFEWTDASRCHRSAQTGGFPAAARAGTCKAMIEQGRGRVSFCSAGRTRSPVSPGTMRADLAHSRGARSTVRWVKVAVGGLASLLQWIGRGASRQRLHIISGRQKLRVFRSLAAGIPGARRACGLNLMRILPSMSGSRTTSLQNM
jgi:hypothetical protein